MSKRLFLAMALLGCLLMLVPGAFGSTIIGLSLNGSTFEDYVPNVVINGTSYEKYHDYTINVGVTGAPPLDAGTLNTNTLDLTSHGAGWVYIAVSQTDQSLPYSPAGFLSGFTSNLMSSGWTVAESTYIDRSNGTFKTTGFSTLLASKTFSAPGAVTVGSGAIALSGVFSETTLYKIHATKAGNTSDSIDITPAPELSSIALFGSGLLGFAGFARRRFLK